MPVDAPLRDVYLSFDGRVLELFDQSVLGGARYFLPMIGTLRIDRGMLSITTLDHTTNVYPFGPEQEPALHALVAAVEAARG